VTFPLSAILPSFVCRVPLIIYHPQSPFRGQHFKSPVELIDVYPTVKELLAAPEPPLVVNQNNINSMHVTNCPGGTVCKPLQGKSLAPIVLGRSSVPVVKSTQGNGHGRKTNNIKNKGTSSKLAQPAMKQGPKPTLKKDYSDLLLRPDVPLVGSVKTPVMTGAVTIDKAKEPSLGQHQMVTKAAPKPKVKLAPVAGPAVTKSDVETTSGGFLDFFKTTVRSIFGYKEHVGHINGQPNNLQPVPSRRNLAQTNPPSRRDADEQTRRKLDKYARRHLQPNATGSATSVKQHTIKPPPPSATSHTHSKKVPQFTVSEQRPRLHRDYNDNSAVDTIGTVINGVLQRQINDTDHSFCAISQSCRCAKLDVVKQVAEANANLNLSSTSYRNMSVVRGDAHWLTCDMAKFAASEVSAMGYSMRTSEFRYTAWFIYNRQTCTPNVDSVPLYEEVGFLSCH
jgi:hypothetical protein